MSLYECAYICSTSSACTICAYICVHTRIHVYTHTHITLTDTDTMPSLPHPYLSPQNSHILHISRRIKATGTKPASSTTRQPTGCWPSTGSSLRCSSRRGPRAARALRTMPEGVQAGETLAPCPDPSPGTINPRPESNPHWRPPPPTTTGMRPKTWTGAAARRTRRRATRTMAPTATATATAAARSSSSPACPPSIPAPPAPPKRHQREGRGRESAAWRGYGTDRRERAVPLPRWDACRSVLTRAFSTRVLPDTCQGFPSRKGKLNQLFWA